MSVIKESFLSNILGRNTYDEFKGYARKVAPIGTCVLIILIGLSLVCHYSIISDLLDLTMGTSLLFIAYVFALILVFDVEVDVNEPDYNIWDEQEAEQKSYAFKQTKTRCIVLVILGFAAIILSNLYRKHYAFECSKFLVDENAGIYHLYVDNDCEIAESASGLKTMKGYQIDKSYTLCEWCEEWAEDAEADYESNRFFRR